MKIFHNYFNTNDNEEGVQRTNWAKSSGSSFPKSFAEKLYLAIY